ncbi:MAG: hypothetical protein HZA93_00990 [Verrucomicrobia bacterium]|nr:hypothetical protein [Verrucomicrobiota bacterium]
MNKLLAGFVGFGAVLLAGALYLQQAAMSELRSEVTALRGDVQEAAKAAKDAARASRPQENVAGAVVTRENEGNDEAKAELARLREEIRGLRTSTQELTQIAKTAAAKSGTNLTPPGKNLLAEMSAAPDNITPVGSMKNAGFGSPAQAVETVLWAATGGEVDALANGLFIEPKAKQKAADWFASLPEATRAQYGSPEKVIALMIAKDAAALQGMQVLGQQEVAPNLMAVRVRMQADTGGTKDETLAFARAPEGWKMVLPENVVQKFAARVSGGK